MLFWNCDTSLSIYDFGSHCIMILILSWVIQLLKNIMIFLGCIAIRDGIEYSEIFSKSIQKCYDKIKNYNILH